MNYTIYDTATGQIKRNVFNADISLQLTNGESYLEGNADPELYYVDNGVLTSKSAKPGTDYTFNYSTKTWELDLSALIQNVLARRKKILEATDWTQIPNNPLTPEKQQEWAVYRQALRDITDQPGYPQTINWPVAPT